MGDEEKGGITVLCGSEISALLGPPLLTRKRVPSNQQKNIVPVKSGIRHFYNESAIVYYFIDPGHPPRFARLTMSIPHVNVFTTGYIYVTTSMKKNHRPFSLSRIKKPIGDNPEWSK
jgi:hypothetical protein